MFRDVLQESLETELDESLGYGKYDNSGRESGAFYPNTTINVRDYSSTQGSILAQYTKGESVVYDSYVVNN